LGKCCGEEMGVKEKIPELLKKVGRATLDGKDLIKQKEKKKKTSLKC
jgi:Sec-independent protein translocase protein TatA